MVAVPDFLEKRTRTFSHFRWLIAGLLFLATTINYADRQVLALLKPMLDKELHWTNEQYGYVNSAFYATYAVSYLFFGWLIDKIGTKRGFAISISLWSFAAISHTFSASVRGFFCARSALGAAEGGAFPACIKATAHWFPKHERAFVASLFNVGANAGAIVAPVLVPWIALAFGWRMAFAAAGVVGLLWLLLWLPLYKDSPAESRFVSVEELNLIENKRSTEGMSSVDISWLRLFALRQTWAIMLAKFLTDPIWWFFLIWLPDFFKKTRGLDMKNSWPHLVAIYTISTVLCIAGGWFTGLLMKRGWTATKARKSVMLFCAICVGSVVLAPKTGNSVAVCLIGLACAAHQAWSANIYASISDLFPRGSVAAVSGIVGMTGSVGGILFPTLAGMILDHYRDTSGGESTGYAILFWICGSAYVVAFVINHLLASRFQPIIVDACKRKPVVVESGFIRPGQYETNGKTISS